MGIVNLLTSSPRWDRGGFNLWNAALQACTWRDRGPSARDYYSARRGGIKPAEKGVEYLERLDIRYWTFMGVKGLDYRWKL